MSKLSSTRIYVGNIPDKITESDLSSAFGSYGRIISCTLKKSSTNGLPFAFIEYEDSREAQDAIKEMDGHEMQGSRLRVEIPFNSRSKSTVRRSYKPRGGKYAVEVTGLPPSGSWQDLKDHFREVAECLRADVYDGIGVAYFSSFSEMEKIIDEFDRSSFKSHNGERSTIYVREKRSRSNRSYSRGRSSTNSSRYDSRRSRRRSYSPPSRRYRSNSYRRSYSNSRKYRDRSSRKPRNDSQDKNRSITPDRNRSSSPIRNRSYSRGRSYSSPRNKNSRNSRERHQTSSREREHTPIEKNKTRDDASN